MRWEWLRLRPISKPKFQGVCKLYYSQVWAEALNQAGVEASSELRKAKNMYYPL